jgi:hypothetical protein
MCPISGSGLSPAHCQPFCLSSLCFLKVLMGDQLLAYPSSPVHLHHPAPSAACSFSVPCLLFSFFCGAGDKSVQGAVLVYPRGGCGNTA